MIYIQLRLHGKIILHKHLKLLFHSLTAKIAKTIQYQHFSQFVFTIFIVLGMCLCCDTILLNKNKRENTIFVGISLGKQCNAFNLLSLHNINLLYKVHENAKTIIVLPPLLFNCFYIEISWCSVFVSKLKIIFTIK